MHPKNKVHILNFISGNNGSLDAEPPKEHPSYDALNDAVRAAFTSTIPALQRVLVVERMRNGLVCWRSCTQASLLLGGLPLHFTSRGPLSLD